MKTVDQIRKENDDFRKYQIGTGTIVLSFSVSESPNKQEIISAARSFDSFDGANDPHREHDFGNFMVGDTKYYFKIDYYDLEKEWGVNPKEEDCHRVLTIMEASEY